jgi:hypothetical protein
MSFTAVGLMIVAMLGPEWPRRPAWKALIRKLVMVSGLGPDVHSGFVESCRASPRMPATWF